MAYTLEELDKLKTAYASGALTVRTEDRTLTYQSAEDLYRAIERIEAELAAQAGRKARRVFYFTPCMRRD